MKKLILLLWIGCAWPLMAQDAPARPGGGGFQGQMPMGKVKGKFVDAETRKPIEFAAILMRHFRDSTLVVGAVSDSTGAFVVENVRPGRYLTTYSFIGYTTRKDTITVRPPDQLLRDLGDVLLKPNVQALNEVEVKGEREVFQLGIDRKIFNVSKNSIAEGGTATDVLRQVPTVDVSIDGGISMRGSANLIILLNGRPSGITGSNRQAILDQIPANTIDRIELITNPSAKYDPDGMSGIINIVTKRNLDDGMNGSLALGAGTRGKQNLSAALNVRAGKWNISTNYGFRSQNNWNAGDNLRDNFLPGLPRNSINQFNSGNRFNESHAVTTNVEYNFDKHNSLAFNGVMGLNSGVDPEDVRYEFLDANRALTRLSQRGTDATRSGQNVDVGLTYRRTYEQPQRELVILSNASLSNNVNYSLFRQQEFAPSGAALAIPALQQRNDVKGNFNVWVTQADYTLPFRKGKIETGAKSTTRMVGGDFFADSLSNAENRWVTDRRLTNNFQYREQVWAAYGIFAQNHQRISYQVGLRAEQTLLQAEQVTTSQTFDNQFLMLFPSASVTYKLKPDTDLQLAYSRRINRPNFQSLNPFADYSDPLNIRVGNPKLLPEKIESLEATYLKTFAQKHTLSTSVYFRQINGVIQRIRTVQPDGTSIVTFENLDYARNFGLEVVLRAQVTKWWSATLNLNAFRNIVYGRSTDGGDLNNSNFSYNLRALSQIKISKKDNLQFTFGYNAPMVLPQGETRPIYGLDLGYRRDFNQKLSLTVNISDLFDNREFGFITAAETFSGSTLRKRESRVANMVVTYRFGKTTNSDTQQRRGRRREDGGDGGGGGMDSGL